MLKYNLKLALRSFLKNRSSFLINVIGLTSGLLCVLLIYFWVNSELQVDKFHEKTDRLYQLIIHYHNEEDIGTGQSTPAQLAETFEEEMPEVAHSIAVRDVDNVTLSVGEVKIRADGKHASSDFFQAFTHPFLEGDDETALSTTNAIVISVDLAKKIFNTTDELIGKTVELQHQETFQITGVFQSLPENATMQFDFILPFEHFKTNNSWALNWNYSTVDTYMTLAENANLNTFNEKIAAFLEDKRVNSMPTTLEAVNYGDLYLNGIYENGKVAGGRIEYVRLFSIIAFFILLIACVNFMNLSTAKASKRLKEIAVKKVIGAKRQTLIAQFLSESCALAFLSLSIALALVWLLLPVFSQVAGKEVTLAFSPNLVLSLLGITLFAGLLAGSYPALYLSGFQPSRAFKNKTNKNSGESWVRKGLVVFQFTISTVLIVAVLIVNQQIDYVQTQNLGYNKENIIEFGLEGQAKEKLSTFLAEVNQLPSIDQASSIGESVVGGNNRFTIQKWEGEENNQVSFEMRAVNYDLLETLNIELSEGRTFSKDFSNEENKVIFNEEAIAFMGLEDPIGKRITIENDELEIIGVTKNFHFASLKEAIAPLFFVFRPSWTGMAMARVVQGKEKTAIAELEALYADFNPGFLLEYEFLDQNYQTQYVAEQR
ncbi:MAG: ABC transporter permease, partial [Bacteroidota bacterium]